MVGTTGELLADAGAAASGDGRPYTGGAGQHSSQDLQCLEVTLKMLHGYQHVKGWRVGHPGPTASRFGRIFWLR